MKRYLFIFFILIGTSTLFSASINVDELNIIADGYINDASGLFELNTYFKFITSFDGGYKFAARIAFESNVRELERSYSDATSDFYNKVFMLFRHAEVSARNLFNSHFNLSFWTGTHKYLGSGNYYRGYLYYPESSDEDYQGFYRLRGTGISAQLKFWEDRFRTEFHLYENTNFVTAETPDVFYRFSFDNEIGLYFNEIPIDADYFNISVELITGMTFPMAIYPYIQGKVGLTFNVGNKFIDFFVSIGLPRIDGTIASMTFDDIYLASDLHFKLFITHHTISFLTRPRWYNEQKYGKNEEGEKNDYDVNYKFDVVVPDFPLNGGFMLNFKYSLNDLSDTWNFILAPFMDISFSGVVWNLAVHYDFSRIHIATLNNYNPSIYMQGFKLIVGASSKF